LLGGRRLVFREERMREHADHHDAELLLRLYDLRREEKLRRAREWFSQQFRAESLEDLFNRYPLGSPENTYLRMTLGYWEMAASIVNRGLIVDDLFFENNSELWMVWTKIAHLMSRWRDWFKNPHLYENLQTLAGKYEKWMEGRSPGALAVLSERWKEPAAGRQ
jgi:hypothetical protein